MQGVIEEKSSRIIEILISSLKPFQLMMGKIIGIGAVGLTQFIIWIGLIAAVTSVVLGYFGLQMPQSQAMDMAYPETAQLLGTPLEVGQMFQILREINYLQLLITFIFYFFGGYLLYGAFFVVIGAAVDSPSDAQQFLFSVTILLILAECSQFV